MYCFRLEFGTCVYFQIEKSASYSAILVNSKQDYYGGNRVGAEHLTAVNIDPESSGASWLGEGRQAR